LSLLFKSDALSFGWTSWHNSCRHYLDEELFAWIEQAYQFAQAK